MFTSEDGLAVVRQLFKELGFEPQEANKRIIVLGSSLKWAGGPAATRRPETAGLLQMEDLLGKGVLKEEENFSGERAHETVYLCYSSGAATRCL